MKPLVMQFPQPHVTSPPSLSLSLIATNILLRILFSYTLNLYYSSSLRYQFPHKYKARGKIIVLCILIFRLSDNRWEDGKF
jgi:hypothetical protein